MVSLFPRCHVCVTGGGGNEFALDTVSGGGWTVVDLVVMSGLTVQSLDCRMRMYD